MLRFAMIVVLMLAGVSIGQTTKPGKSAPPKVAAEVRQAMKDGFAATSGSDLDKVRQLYSGDADAIRLRMVFQELLVASRTCERVADLQLTGGRLTTTDDAANAKRMSAIIDTLPVEGNENEAIVRIGNTASKFVRTSGGWKQVVEPMPADSDVDKTEQAATKLTAAWKELHVRVERKEFATFEQYQAVVTPLRMEMQNLMNKTSKKQKS